MSISVKVTPKTKTVLLNLENAPKIHKRGIKKSLHEIGVLVGRENKRIITTGVRTGRVYRFRGQSHRASAPHEAPANRTGRLVKSYDYRVSGWREMRVGEDAPYAKFLEDGTKKMRRRQHLIRAINNVSGDAVRILYSNGIRGVSGKK